MSFHHLSPNDWIQLWADKKQDFHVDHLLEIFLKNVDTMLKGREKVKIFVPMCGKALEMKWLYDHGHEIVGVDCAEIALKQFFEENKIEYRVTDEPSTRGKLFVSDDGRLRLYCCDFYAFSSNIENGFEAIWDSGSLIAINDYDETKYIDIIKSMMKEDCVMLIDVDEFKDWKMNVDLEKLKNWFSEGYIVEKENFLPADDTLTAMGITGQNLYKVVKPLQMNNCR